MNFQKIFGSLELYEFNVPTKCLMWNTWWMKQIKPKSNMFITFHCISAVRPRNSPSTKRTTTSTVFPRSLSRSCEHTNAFTVDKLRFNLCRMSCRSNMICNCCLGIYAITTKQNGVKLRKIKKKTEQQKTRSRRKIHIYLNTFFSA